jgi:DNA polymerase-1
MANFIGFDIETTELSPFNETSEILTVAMHSWNNEPVAAKRKALYHVDHPIRKMTRHYDNVLVGHNVVSFDAVWWERHIAPIGAKFFDTCVAWSLIDENDKNNSLAGLADKLLGIEVDTDMKAQRANLASMPIEKVLEYNKEDARISFELGDKIYHILDEHGKWPLFEWIMDVSKPLVQMMVRGVQIDPEWIERHATQLQKEAFELYIEINRMVGRDDEMVNIDSPVQLRELLFGELGMETSVMTKTGSMSTSNAAVKEIQSRVSSEYPDVSDFLQLILDYRKTKKLAKTYLVPYQEKHADEQDRVHTRYFLGKSYAGGMKGGTVTGRLSSSEPNLQNIPRDYRVKGAFIPTTDDFPGHYPWSMFEVDYKQLEVRVAAWYSKEEMLLDAITAGRDIHSHTLSLTSGRPYHEIMDALAAGDRKTKEDRTLVKRVVFGTLYGIGPFALQGLMRDMGIEVSLKRAKDSIRDFFNAYPKLKHWIDMTELTIMEDGYITTPTGRVRHLPGATAMTAEGRAKLRQGVNFRIQSLASDITLLGLQSLDLTFRIRKNQERLLLTVHDSIVGEYRDFPDRDHKELETQITHDLTHTVNVCLENRFDIDRPLPLAVDTKMNMTRWGTKDD